MSFPRIILDNGANYFANMNAKQRLFHTCSDKFRWLGGGVGGGKSVAGLVEALRHSWHFPNNYGFILRKTFPELRTSAIKDFKAVCPDCMIYRENHNEHWVDVLNEVGYEFMYKLGGQDMPKRQQERELYRRKGTSRIEFISFEGTLDAEKKFRSANLGWYFIEQAESASVHVYNALNQRLRRVPSGRQAWFVSNPDGRDWLWYMFHESSPDKREGHTHIPVELHDNTALPADYDETLKDTYTADDYERFVKGSHDVSVDAVFPEFSRTHHVVDHFDPPHEWKKAVGLDPGIANPTAFILAAKFPPPHDNIIYFYHEYQERDQVVSTHAHALLPFLTPSFECFAIDPDSKKRDRVHADTVIGEYNMLGIPFQSSSRDISAGVNRMKEYMRYDAMLENPVTGRLGSPRFLVSERCPLLIEQILQYRKAEQKTGRGFVNPPEKFRDYNDHLVCAVRYLLVRWMRALSVKSDIKGFEQSRPQRFRSRRGGLGIDMELFDDDLNFTMDKLIADSRKVRKSPRVTHWLSA